MSERLLAASHLTTKAVVTPVELEKYLHGHIRLSTVLQVFAGEVPGTRESDLQRRWHFQQEGCASHETRCVASAMDVEQRWDLPLVCPRPTVRSSSCRPRGSGQQ